MPATRGNYTPDEQVQFCEAMRAKYGDVVTTKQINEFVSANDKPFPHFLLNSSEAKAGWGKYRVTALLKAKPVEAAPVPLSVAVEESTTALVPAKDPTFVGFGFYEDMKKIIASRIFYPMYITGQSGNGKTLGVIQACAELDRELVRVNITKDTDELDLFGSYELINGNTVRREGPVITAMKRGAVLLLDETDYGSERLLCLQPVLEGKPFLDKKTNTIIYPQPGFTVFATANTKGKGSADGRFMGANVLNEAFLERFAITVEQDFPSPQIETKILLQNFSLLGVDLKIATTMVKCLVKWAEMNRKTFKEGACADVLSTRRLTHIAKAFSIFNSRKKAVELCLNRFETESKESLLDLYTKIDVEVDREEKAELARQEAARKAEQVAAERAKNPPQATAQTVSTFSPASVKGPTSSDIAFMPQAARMTRDYKENVVIVEQTMTNPMTGINQKVTAVYSHGFCSTSADVLRLGAGQAMEKELKRLVEANLARKLVGSTATP